MIKELHKYKFHPQTSSVRKANLAARAADFPGKTILDPFCGTGTLLWAAVANGACKVIGSDMENYQEFLRLNVREALLTHLLAEQKFHITWNLDALEAVKKFKFDVLFTDPPNPTTLIGGATISIPRDIKKTGNDLSRFWKPRLNPKNLMNKRKATIRRVRQVVDVCLEMEKEVVVNLFTSDRCKFEYARYFKEYDLTNIAASYYRIE